MPLRVPLAFAELLIGWVLLTSIGQRGHPWPVVGAVALAAGAFVLAHAVPGPARPFVAVSLGVLSLGAVLLGSGPVDFVLAGPLGYANANAALAVQAGAALALVAASDTPRARWLGLAGAAAALVTTLLIGAVAASAGALLVMLAVVAPGSIGRRVSVVLSASAVVAASLLPFAVGLAGVDSAGAGADALTGRRVDLWTDGVAAVSDRPWLGVGAREFPAASPTAAADADTREAHAELLQRTVESGLPGALLEAGAVVLVMLPLGRRAWTGGAGSRAALIGLAGLCALWSNAGVDYILAFPAVLALGWAVAGLASPPPRWRRAQRAQAGSSERPSSAT